MNAGLGSSATQQAIVQSFLKNFDKVWTAYDGRTVFPNGFHATSAKLYWC